ncbi:response regulator [Puniceicoccaceae bacterium K14]|nr:response regulator [Puniceicoccaceae bacterium K14]
MKISVLLVEDSKVITKLILSLLNKADSIEFEVSTAASFKEAKQLLETQQYACVLLDLTLPDSAANDTYSRLHSIIPDIPIVVTSGSSNDQLALNAMKRGAQDYLLKSDLSARLLAKAITYSIERKKLLLEAEEKEKVLRLQLEAAEAKISRQNKLLGKNKTTACSQDFDLQLSKEEAKRILLVEDSVVNQKLTTIMLEKLGLEVSVAENGEKAIQAFQEQPYHLVLMDIQMPVMDGVTATKALRESYGPEEKVVIIALSATASDEMKETFQKTGFNEVLTKPVDPEILDQTFAQYLR